MTLRPAIFNSGFIQYIDSHNTTSCVFWKKGWSAWKHRKMVIQEVSDSIVLPNTSWK